MLTDSAMKVAARHDLLYNLYKRTASRIAHELSILHGRNLQARLLKANGYNRYYLAEFQGIKMQLDLYSMTDVYFLDGIQKYGTYERATSHYLFSSLRMGDTFVDVGANSGYYSLLAARLLGESGSVYSIEPSPSSLIRLRTNVGLNLFRNITVIPKAAWMKTTTRLLYRSGSADGTNSLIQPRNKGVIMVDCARLDSMLPEGMIQLVKIDVEGAEMEVLMGAREILNSHRIRGLVIEWNRALRSGSRELILFFEYLEKIGKVFEIAEGHQKAYHLRGPIRDWRALPLFCSLLVVPQNVS